MRYGENALAVIENVKKRLEQLKAGLPEGVRIIPVYDRSGLILRAVDNLKKTLIEESVIVALVCIIFLFHLRSAFVAIFTLPVGIFISLIIMERQGVNANIMSLSGIAIAIGAMVDAAIVMIENAHNWTGSFLFSFDHCHQLFAGIYPGGPGRPALQAPGLY
jgi:Cu(I)/Ag(I) efflux system membrane protein CusA/SilA